MNALSKKRWQRLYEKSHTGETSKKQNIILELKYYEISLICENKTNCLIPTYNSYNKRMIFVWNALRGLALVTQVDVNSRTWINGCHRNVPKFSDIHVWANSVDPVQSD